MTEILFPSHLLFQEKNYFKLKPICEELQKQVHIQLNSKDYSNDSIKQLLKQCQEIGISDKFKIEITRIYENLTSQKELSECIQLPCIQQNQKYSDADYEKLQQEFDSLENKFADISNDSGKLKQELQHVKELNLSQEKQIEDLQKQLLQCQDRSIHENLALSHIEESENIVQPENIFKQKSVFIDESHVSNASNVSNDSSSNQKVQISTVESQVNNSMNISQSVASIKEKSKMIRKTNIISLETSKLESNVLIDIEFKIKDQIKIYKYEQSRLEKKDADRIEKLLQKNELMNQKKQKSMDLKQKQLMDTQKQLNDKLNQQRKIKMDREEQQRKHIEEENRRKQEIVDKRTELENKKLQEKLDNERKRIDEKLSKHKSKLGM